MSVTGHRNATSDIQARFAVLTCSDSRTKETDSSGAFIRDRLDAGGHTLVHYEIVPDDPARIDAALSDVLSETPDLILLTGGTGVTRRDSTPDVVQKRFERRLPGFGELFRVLSYEEIGAAAMLSRATAGTIGRTAVFCLPGSSAAVRLAMEELIMPELTHLVGMLRG